MLQALNAAPIGGEAPAAKAAAKGKQTKATAQAKSGAQAKQAAKSRKRQIDELVESDKENDVEVTDANVPMEGLLIQRN
jgi:hypothetical protein